MMTYYSLGHNIVILLTKMEKTNTQQQQKSSPDKKALIYYEVEQVKGLANSSQHLSLDQIQPDHILIRQRSIIRPSQVKALHLKQKQRQSHICSGTFASDYSLASISSIDTEFTIDYSNSSRIELLTSILKIKERISELTLQLNRTIQDNNKVASEPKAYYQDHFVKVLLNQKMNLSKVVSDCKQQLEKIHRISKRIESKPRICQIELKIDKTTQSIDLVKRSIQKLTKVIAVDNQDVDQNGIIRQQASKSRDMESIIFKSQRKWTKLKEIDESLQEKVTEMNLKTKKIEEQYQCAIEKVVQNRLSINPNYSLMKITKKYKDLQQKHEYARRGVFLARTNTDKKYQLLLRQVKDWRQASRKMQFYIQARTEQCQNLFNRIDDSVLNKVPKNNVVCEILERVRSKKISQERFKLRGKSNVQPRNNLPEQLQLTSLSQDKIALNFLPQIKIETHPQPVEYEESLPPISILNSSKSSILEASNNKLKKRKKTKFTQQLRLRSLQSQDMKSYEQVVFRSELNESVNPQLTRQKINIVKQREHSAQKEALNSNQIDRAYQSNSLNLKQANPENRGELCFNQRFKYELSHLIRDETLISNLSGSKKQQKKRHSYSIRSIKVHRTVLALDKSSKSLNE